MSTLAKQRLLDLLDKLIDEGTAVRQLVAGDGTEFSSWFAGCRNLMNILGAAGSHWQYAFSNSANSHQARASMLGTLRAIKKAIDGDLLISIEDLVFAEAFDDLLEQAEYLLDGGYFIAAGVLGRAVLEEHLRKWCDRVPCKPAKPKPTLNDFKAELQKAGKLNALEVKQVDWLGGVGNDCAHNLGKSTQADVEKLLRDVRDFLAQHPLPQRPAT